MRININNMTNQRFDYFSNLSVKPSLITENHNSRDDIKISRLGMDLSRIDSNKTSQSTLNASEVFKGDRLLEMVGRSVAKIEETMERMTNLAKIAEEDYLSQKDRLTLQKEMFDLQSDLFRDTHYMGLKRAGFSEEEILNDYLSEVEKQKDLSMMMIEKGARSSGQTPFSDNGDNTVSLDIALSFQGGDTILKGVKFERQSYGLRLTGKKEDILDCLDGSEQRLSYEGFIDQSNLSLLSSESAKESRDLLDEKLQSLTKMTDSLVKSCERTPLEERVKEKSSQKTVNKDEDSEDKLKVDYHNPENSPFISDLRLKETNSISKSLFQSADSFFKDQIYESLGLGSIVPRLEDETVTVLC